MIIWIERKDCMPKNYKALYQKEVRERIRLQIENTRLLGHLTLLVLHFKQVQITMCAAAEDAETALLFRHTAQSIRTESKLRETSKKAKL